MEEIDFQILGKEDDLKHRDTPRTAYYSGAIYLTVMNLPRSIRNKKENILLAGLIPGPQEPEHDLNSFLEPLVEDLLHFWD